METIHAAATFLQSAAMDEEAKRLQHEARFAERPAPMESTAHRPGSLGKIEVLRKRYAAGEGLHHPSDATDMVRQRSSKSQTPEES